MMGLKLTSFKYENLDTKQTTMERIIVENYTELKNMRVFDMSSKTLKIR